MNDEFLDEDFAQYTNLQALQQRLAQLRNKDFTNYSSQEMRDELRGYLEMIPALITKFEINNFNNSLFYRVRLNVNTNSENMSMIRTYSYPAPQYCTINGRANLKNKSVFYCSNSPITAIRETKPKIGDIGYLSIWQGNTNREIRSGIYLPEGLPRENEWSSLAKDINLFSKKKSEADPKGKGIYFQELLRFVSELFLNELPPYWLTSWIANESLFGYKPKDVIVYPSYINQARSCNLAFHPNTVDRFLLFKKVVRFKIIDIKNDNYKITSGRVGEVISTDMEFRYANPGELNFFGAPASR